MTDPRYVRSLSDIYTKMYNHPGEERPLIGENVEDVPKWKRLLRNGLKEENRKKPPYAADVNDQEDASEEEESSLADHQAQQYLETIIDEVPTAVGGVNIHRVIKDAFIAGTNAS